MPAPKPAPTPAPRVTAAKALSSPLATTDSATNTDAKSVSDTSTQTVVTRRFHRSSSVSREPQKPPMHRYNSEPQLYASEKEAEEEPTSITPEKPPQLTASHSETPERTPCNRRLYELLQHTPLQRCETPTSRSNESVLSDVSSPTCFNQSHNITVLANDDAHHTCKHNCEHCFYI